ncbi:MAG: glycosyltransferase family 4 protein [Phycisphaerales bacterium]|nr:glycosyltransferase family 4 protein [Phycisphaerales bacterium]
MSSTSGLRVYLCPGDQAGWAIDEDSRLARRALEGVVEFVERPEDADVIHAPWWEPLMALPQSAIGHRPVVCHMVGQPVRCLADPRFVPALERVTHWVAQSRAAAADLPVITGGVGAAVTYIPYPVDATTFMHPGEETWRDPLILRVSKQLPRAGYVIANFHRDSEGAGLRARPVRAEPKLVKGPDVFVEILAALRGAGEPVVALLAGPRRHWIRAELVKRGVPIVFAGEEAEGDDYPANSLTRSRLAVLYRLADLHLCASRSEGGPHSILEAAASGTAQLSTPVGHAPDVLAAECLFTDAASAVEMIRADIRGKTLPRYVPVHQAMIEANHTPERNCERWRAFYTGLTRETDTFAGARRRAARRVPARMSSGDRRVCLWNNFTPPPWGGGNQFMLALKAECERQGFEVSVNGEFDSSRPVMAHVLNSVQFPIEKFEEGMAAIGASGEARARVVHRLDGPIAMIRRTPEALEQDTRCFGLNERYAAATVVQSWHTIRAIREMGFDPVRPVLIPNGVEPAYFHRGVGIGQMGVAEDATGGRIRVIATSWSPGPSKGASVYAWMDRNLDPARFEMTFVGNVPATLKNWRKIDPQPSEKLGQLLREHDVYITASRDDPCSNALIEAMACGLPALYFNGGGHPELAQFGGLPFTRADEIPGLLERLATHRPMYRNLIAVPDIATVCRRYMSLCFGHEAYAGRSGG